MCFFRVRKYHNKQITIAIIVLLFVFIYYKWHIDKEEEKSQQTNEDKMFVRSEI